MTVCDPGGMKEPWIDWPPESGADAIHLDVVADPELGTIVRATGPDGREATAAESA